MVSREIDPQWQNITSQLTHLANLYQTRRTGIIAIRRSFFFFAYDKPCSLCNRIPSLIVPSVELRAKLVFHNIPIWHLVALVRLTFIKRKGGNLVGVPSAGRETNSPSSGICAFQMFRMYTCLKWGFEFHAIVSTHYSFLDWIQAHLVKYCAAHNCAVSRDR